MENTRQDLAKLKELITETKRLTSCVEREFMEKWPLITSISIFNSWCDVNSNQWKMTLWSGGSITETHNCPTKPPKTVEEFQEYSEATQAERQQCLTALYYIKFRR